MDIKFARFINKTCSLAIWEVLYCTYENKWVLDNHI